MAKVDPAVRAHLEWLGFVQPTGLVVSAPALVRAGAILDRRDAEGQELLRGCVEERVFGPRADPEPCLPDFRGGVWYLTAEPQPGDAIVERPRIETTRAITIQACAAEVWPWLVQMGQGRGGFYSYDWLENLMGLDIHSAGRIVPELQDLQVGDILPNGPETPDEGVVVAGLEPERALILRGTLVPGRPMKDYPIHYDETTTRWFSWTWAFILDQLEDQTTRLIARLRMDYQGLAPAMALHLLMEPSHFVMERKMLLSIKERVEGAPELA